MLHALTSTSSNIILCGDFNVPNIDWSNLSPTSSSPAAVLLCDLIADNFLSQLVYTPTHGKNILDLILTNCQHILSQLEVVTIYLALIMMLCIMLLMWILLSQAVVNVIYRIAGYFRGGKFSRILWIGLYSRIFSP